MTILSGARVVTTSGVLADGWVEVLDTRIRAVGSGPVPAGEQRVDLGGAWLLPGYVDLHMHGGGGYDVTASIDSMRGAVAFHRRHGTTRTLVSLVAAPPARLRERLGWVLELTGPGTTAAGGVLGAHLEGPFLSSARCGAQNPQYLLAPDQALLAELIGAAHGCVRCVTVAPELAGALELIADLRAAGIVAAIGHSDATYAQARAAIDAGAGLATHLFNGMRPMHHREPGIVGAVLDSDLPAELINDGVHLHPAVLSLVARNPSRAILVTDAIDAAGIGDGAFSLGGQPVQVRDGQARLLSTGGLAGSTLTMDQAVRRAVLDSGLPMELAAAAAATNPARVLGLQDECGAIAPGLAADLVVLDDDLRVLRVMAAGAWNEP